MWKLEWDVMGVKVDGRELHHLRLTDDRLDLQKTMFMRNGWVSDAPFTLNRTNISECTSYVYLGRELNMKNDLTSELGRRKRAIMQTVGYYLSSRFHGCFHFLKKISVSSLFATEKKEKTSKKMSGRKTNIKVIPHIDP
ncbi:hypothetical protein RB195_006639 [Necator americanus]|uniref:Uncharacterized protein n=1 Tax=Necator americanus TaxID=51031 RepID=A0ABR1BTK1_NECAM